MRVPIAEAKSQLCELVSMAAAGAPVTLTVHGKDQVHLVSAKSDVRQRFERARALTRGQKLNPPGMPKITFRDLLERR